jgi:bifunctional non-homologous end joining protein LigD
MFIPCQLASTAPRAPIGEGWIFERKHDGYRAQLHFTPTGPRIFSRNGLDWTERFRPLAAAPCTELTGCVLDGEICAYNAAGQSSFSQLCRQFRDDPALKFHAFDLLVDGGIDLQGLPLLERKRRLAEELGTHALSPLELVRHTIDGASLLAEAQAEGWEGIMAKRDASVYRPGERTDDWRKVKCRNREEFVILGWRPQLDGGVKSIVLASPGPGGTLTPRGSVGSGFSIAERRTLAREFAELGGALPATFTPDRAVRGLQPRLFAEIEFLEITAKGSVREPRFLGVRRDRFFSD